MANDTTPTPEKPLDMKVTPVESGKEFKVVVKGNAPGDGNESFELGIKEGVSKVKKPGQHNWFVSLFHHDKSKEKPEYAVDANKETSVYLKIGDKTYSAEIHGGNDQTVMGVHARSKKHGDKEVVIDAHTYGDAFVDKNGKNHEAHIDRDYTNIQDHDATVRKLAVTAPDVVQAFKNLVLKNGETGKPSDVHADDVVQLAGMIAKNFADSKAPGAGAFANPNSSTSVQTNPVKNGGRDSNGR